MSCVCVCKLCVSKLYVSKLYVSKLCVSKLCVSKLCVSKLCVSKLCVSKLCVSKLCVCKLCVSTRRREADEGGRDAESKTRTPHKDVGEKQRKNIKILVGTDPRSSLRQQGTEARKSWETKSCSTKKNTNIDFRSARKLLKNLGKSRDMPLTSR